MQRTKSIAIAFSLIIFFVYIPCLSADETMTIQSNHSFDDETGYDDELVIQDTERSFDDEDTDDEIIEIGSFDNNEIITREQTDTTESPGNENYLEKILQPFLNNSKFTYRHEIAVHTKKIEDVILNRSSLLLEWQDLFASKYYVFFDGKISYDFSYDYLDYSKETEEEYKFQHQMRKLYFQSGNKNTSFKLGKQIVVWGEAEGGIITDIISPRDSTEFIFTQLEDTRIGQYMLTVDNYTDYGQVSFILNPDSRANIYPERGHKYAAPSFDTMDGFNVKAPYKSSN